MVEAVESAFDLRLDGTMASYPSYINRVYEVRDEEGVSYVVKFYRPGRWSEEAIREEHHFVLDCAEAEVPVIAPLANSAGDTLSALEVERDQEGDGVEGTGAGGAYGQIGSAAGGTAGRERGAGRVRYLFALYPRRGGRNFDPESDGDWIRLGAVVARIHTAAVRRTAEHRLRCDPEGSTRMFLEELRSEDVVHPRCRDQFFELAERGVSLISPLFRDVPVQRLHGDCHRGNILDRPGAGLLVMDFDDMMMGPAVQDLWLLLPDRAPQCRRELELILSGYEEMRPFDRTTLRLIEPLRFMRMIYFLAWSAGQRSDRGFQESTAGWGGEAFWMKEIEELGSQLEVITGEIRAATSGGTVLSRS